MEKRPPKNHAISAEEALSEFRKQITHEVHAQFARYGDEVSTLITASALKPGGLQRLLHILALPPATQYAEQLDRLARYLSVVGGIEFMRHVRAGSKGKAPAKLAVSFNSDATQASRPIDRTEIYTHAPFVVPAVPTRRSPQQNQATQPEPAQQALHFLERVIDPLTPSAAPEGKPAPDPAREQTADKLRHPVEPALPTKASHTPADYFDARGRYIGPERRKGDDRRGKPDRRQDVESIARNRRFGGDRRKSGGRRKTDR